MNKYKKEEYTHTYTFLLCTKLHFANYANTQRLSKVVCVVVVADADSRRHLTSLYVLNENLVYSPVRPLRKSALDWHMYNVM